MAHSHLAVFIRTPTLPDVQAQIEALLLKGRGPQKLNQPHETQTSQPRSRRLLRRSTDHPQAALILLLMAGFHSVSQGALLRGGML